MKKFLTFIFGIIVTLVLSIIPASANSAVRKWTAPGAHGVYLVSDNPIDVKKEDLTFSEMVYNTVAGFHGTFVVIPAWLVGVWFWPFIMTLDGPISNFLFNSLI